MTPAQEACNAATMLLPSLSLVLWCQKQQPRTTHAEWILLFGTCMHLPSSFSYHLQCALDPSKDRIDNDLRRLDQSMQHAVAPMFAYALSHGSWTVAALNVPLNAYGIAKLWDASTCNDGRRWRLVGISMLLYMAPMLARGDWSSFACATASGSLGAALFVASRALGGWGHCGFHVCMAGFALCLARSASCRASSC
jgi:hypothetical protein